MKRGEISNFNPFSWASFRNRSRLAARAVFPLEDFASQGNLTIYTYLSDIAEPRVTTSLTCSAIFCCSQDRHYRPPTP